MELQDKYIMAITLQKFLSKLGFEWNDDLTYMSNRFFRVYSLKARSSGRRMIYGKKRTEEIRTYFVVYNFPNGMEDDIAKEFVKFAKKIDMSSLSCHEDYIDAKLTLKEVTEIVGRLSVPKVHGKGLNHDH